MSDRHEMQAAGTHPAPCARHCESTAYEIEIRRLRAELAAAAPAPAGVPMPKPVAYGFGNTAITGHTNRLMMVRIDIPGGDQYAGAFWLPLVLADEAHTYGVACRAAGEAAGYARGLADERERICAAIKAEDDYCVTEGDYMLDSDDCIKVARGTWERPDYALRGEAKP